MHKEQLREQRCITLTLSVLCKGVQMSTYKLFWKLASALGEWGYVLPKRIGISYRKSGFAPGCFMYMKLV